MKILVVDDEAPARDRLRQLLEDDGDHQVIGEAGNGIEALKIAETTQPDVVLLDIRMPGMDGIEAAHHLNKLESPPAVVFATAYDEYAIDAFEANAIGYVLKPVRRARLQQALEQAARLSRDSLANIGESEAVSEPRRHVCARISDSLKLIPIETVRCFLADQKYVNVIHSEGSDLIDDSLKALEREFEVRFVRIHRGALVAVDAIASLEKNRDGQVSVLLRDTAPDGAIVGDEDGLTVSRRHVANVRQRIRKG